MNDLAQIQARPSPLLWVGGAAGPGPVPDTALNLETGGPFALETSGNLLLESAP